MNISTSIHDFSPLFRGPEYLFKGLKNTGVSGIELDLGFKSRWSPSTYMSLSKKYDLPIVSLHQPLWSYLGLYFDDGFFSLAEKMNIKTIVCHPLPGLSFKDEKMRKYLKKLSVLQKQHNMQILIENLPQKYNHKVMNHFFTPDNDTGNMQSLYTAIKEFNLGIVLDIDHIRSVTPQDESWFGSVFPFIKNIHLSSFTKTKKHQPLYLGDFKAKKFVDYLKKHSYKGLLTLEINSPRLLTFGTYDFDAIKKSVAVITK